MLSQIEHTFPFAFIWCIIFQGLFLRVSSEELFSLQLFFFFFFSWPVIPNWVIKDQVVIFLIKTCSFKVLYACNAVELKFPGHGINFFITR